MSESEEFWLSISSFGDSGITPQIWSKNIPLDRKELVLVSNYYAVVMGSASDNSLIGPLPVAYHPELLVMISRFETVDHRLQDPRVVKEGYKTQAFFMIFFKSSLDEVMSQMRRRIIERLAGWTKKVAEIEKVKMTDLKEIYLFVERLRNQDQFKPRIVSGEELGNRKLFARQIDFFSKIVEKPHQIDIISEEPAFLLAVQEALIVNGWTFIKEFKQFPEKGSFKIEVDKVSITGYLPAEKKLKLKGKSIIYFAEVCGKNTDKTTVNLFNQIIESMIKKQQVLLVMFCNDGNINFEESLLFETAASAVGKSVQMVHLSPGKKNFMDSLVTFMYQLHEKGSDS